jgi:2-C-methyl-D-erythritol 4-phosphate cytidylyltransferase
LNGEVSYLDRSHKYVVQTPQTIQYKFWKESEIKDDHAITDLFTYLQLKLKKENLVNGNLLNYKITTVADLKLI